MGVNFINILRPAFMLTDPKSAKRYWQLNWIFTLLESARVKAACKMMMNLTPGGNPIELRFFSFSESFFKVDHSVVYKKLFFFTTAKLNHNCTFTKKRHFHRIASGVNFTNIFQAAFSYKSVLKIYNVLTPWVCNFLAKMNWQKRCS